jgi:hypothetical protein
MVQRLANLAHHRKARNGVAVAPTGLAHVLAPAFTPHWEVRPPPNAPELRTLIRRMTMENRFWGQRRIQAELASLGFKVSARTVAK